MRWRDPVEAVLPEPESFARGHRDRRVCMGLVPARRGVGRDQANRFRGRGRQRVRGRAGTTGVAVDPGVDGFRHASDRLGPDPVPDDLDRRRAGVEDGVPVLVVQGR